MFSSNTYTHWGPIVFPEHRCYTKPFLLLVNITHFQLSKQDNTRAAVKVKQYLIQFIQQTI